MRRTRRRHGAAGTGGSAGSSNGQLSLGARSRTRHERTPGSRRPVWTARMARGLRSGRQASAERSRHSERRARMNWAGGESAPVGRRQRVRPGSSSRRKRVSPFDQAGRIVAESWSSGPRASGSGVRVPALPIRAPRRGRRGSRLRARSVSSTGAGLPIHAAPRGMEATCAPARPGCCRTISSSSPLRHPLPISEGGRELAPRLETLFASAPRRLARPRVRSADCGLSAGILTAWPARPSYAVRRAAIVKPPSREYNRGRSPSIAGRRPPRYSSREASTEGQTMNLSA